MLMAVAALVAAVAVPLAPVGAGAGEAATTDVYVLHGLNLGPPDEGGGGTPVTVCTDEVTIDDDFQFGEILGPIPLETGVPVPVQVYPGENEPCADPFADPLIDAEVTPEGEAVALVATAGPGVDEEPGEFELLPFELDLSCYEPGNGRVTGAHAAAAPPVELLLDEVPVTTLAYGESITATLPAGEYDIEVVLGETTLVTSQLALEAGVSTALLVVGNQPATGAAPSPVTALGLDIPLEMCEVPVTQPTTAPTTAAPTTTAAARPAAAQPRFTG
jgi:hypothetical protein